MARKSWRTAGAVEACRRRFSLSLSLNLSGFGAFRVLEKDPNEKREIEDRSRTGLHDFTRASRKAEESASRRLQAVEWLESFVEKEFIPCLRNDLILCNAINKIQPESVPRVVLQFLSPDYWTSPSVSLIINEKKQRKKVQVI
ncbi:putative calponin domain-containing protein [Rosa chinensis]|uniref:Putative calponin domain-containing protein n=1 Tax=Rosa chinensis TaxID=74649 RepID=A0A2P6RL84_ROSCH|nr:kinesin-like protein KIN-14L [Rosa chinensis]PRQ47163.1 putative calponin domain-containing protein [Rosa chinensis]